MDSKSITVGDCTVELLKPITLAEIIRRGNVGCEEFREEYNDFEEVVGDPVLGLSMFDEIQVDEEIAKIIIDNPKWKDFLVQHGFIRVKDVEREFKLRKGDVITIAGISYMIAATDYGKISLVNIITGTRWGGLHPVHDNDNISFDEFKAMLGSKRDDWKSIYATKCRIKDIITEKA